MADSFVQVAPDAGGKLIDNQTVQALPGGAVPAGSVLYRQTITIGDPADVTDIVNVENTFLSTRDQWGAMRAYLMAQQLMLAAHQQAAGGGVGNGFFPAEYPSFLGV